MPQSRGLAALCNYRFFALFAVWVSAEPATDLTDGGDFGLLNNFDAFVATDFEVVSFGVLRVAMKASYGGGCELGLQPNVMLTGLP